MSAGLDELEIEDLVEALNGELKAAVQHPGARGGTYYIDDKGIVRYGTKPPPKAARGKKGPKAKKGPDPAKTAAAKAKAEMRQAVTNAKSEVRDIGSLADAQKLGWEDAAGGKVSTDPVAVNEQVRELGKAHPDRVVAAVKVDGGYAIVSKPIDKLKGDRSNTITRDAGADRAGAQRQADAQKRAQAQTDRQARQQLDRAQRDQERSQRQQAREEARQQRQAERDRQRALERRQRDAERAQRQAAKGKKELSPLLSEGFYDAPLAALVGGQIDDSKDDLAVLKEGSRHFEPFGIRGGEYKEAARKFDSIEGAMQGDFEQEIKDTYRAFADDHDYDFGEHEAEVKALLHEYYPELMAAAYGDAEDVHGLKVSYDARNPRVVKAIDELVGERVKGIADTTKETLKDLVYVQTEAGLSPGQLAKLIVEHGVTDSKSRAETIARTETATAYNHGAILAYREAGLSHVTVHDGDHDEVCAAAAGKTWTLDEAQASPIGHPNCRRAFSPVVG